MITLSGERTVLDVLSHGQPCSPPQGQSSSPTRTSPLYLAWLSWPYGKNRESQYLGRLLTSTKLSVIKQNVYLNCEAVRERVIEMNYRKQYWKFTGYLHTCRVQCFLALLFFFSYQNYRNWGAFHAGTLFAEMPAISHFSSISSLSLPPISSIILCAWTRCDNKVMGPILLTNRVFTTKRMSHLTWSGSHFSPTYFPLLTSSFASALKGQGTFFL